MVAPVGSLTGPAIAKLNTETTCGQMRAMRQFVRSRMDTEFWKKACRLEVRSYERLVALILANARDIRHPEPNMAVSLG
jgi:hypothetical protein